MNKLRCNRGHFYDGDKYASCPHCPDNGDQWLNANSDINGSYWNGEDSTQTVPVNEYGSPGWGSEWNERDNNEHEMVSAGDDDGPTMGFYPPMSPQNAAPQGGWNTPGGTENGMDWGGYGDETTVGIYPTMSSKPGNFDGGAGPANLEPAVGWLICIEGGNRGRDYRISAGNNTIGRSASNSIALIGDQGVSREQHAIVVYDPKSNTYYALPGNSRGLCYVNGKVILNVTELKKNDVLELGASKLMLIPCCDEKFNWNMVYDK